LLSTVVLFSFCGKGKEKADGVTERGNLESDYIGKITALINTDSLAGQDSLKLLQYAYQAASLDARLYELQNALVKSYFWACHAKCEKQRCSPGNIIAASVAYALDGNLDSAVVLADLTNRELIGKSAEVAEIVQLIRLLIEHKADGDLLQPYYDGRLKTPAAIDFWAIITLDMGAPPDNWLGILTREIKKSSSPSLKYAFAYAQSKSGNPLQAWRLLPDYVPLANSFPPPSFNEEVTIGDSIYSQKIYLTVDLYVIKQVSQAFSKNLLEKYPNQNSASVKALIALAKTKGLEQFKNLAAAVDSPGEQPPQNPAGQLLNAIRLAEIKSGAPAENLATLSDAVSRAAFLKTASDNAGPKNKDQVRELILAEIDSSRANRVWESKVLLSLALRQCVSPSKAFSRMNNLGVSDLSVRNNSPEWLAIYAETGLEESSQMALVSQIGFNLTQHYPYAIGVYELMQNLNHICKYY
jgi:hypothetical protein